MISNIPSVFLLFACTILISSAYKLTPPTNYTWPQNTTNLCFAGRFDLALNVEYLRSDGAKHTVKVRLDNSTYESYSVSCAGPTNVNQLKISMLSNFTEITFQFSVDDKNVTSLTNVSVSMTFNDKQEKYFPNYANSTEGVHQFSSNESLFTTERGSSYRCNTKTAIEGFNTNGGVTVKSIDVENLRIQPFADDSQAFSDYGVEKVCEADIDKNSNLIPIIVGACLAVLVVIVLVAYLIGRRRSRNGYQSV